MLKETDHLTTLQVLSGLSNRYYLLEGDATALQEITSNQHHASSSSATYADTATKFRSITSAVVESQVCVHAAERANGPLRRLLLIRHAEDH